MAILVKFCPNWMKNLHFGTWNMIISVLCGHEVLCLDLDFGKYLDPQLFMGGKCQDGIVRHL